MNATVSRNAVMILAATLCYTIEDRPAHADDWGCKVILCLSNPSGPTQFEACRPPIERLWRDLAKGRSFPTCNAVGFSVSQPGYEPYFCSTGFRLTSRYGDGRQEAACVSLAPREVSSSRCGLGERDGDRDRQLPAHWVQVGDRLVCKATVTTSPNRREKPRFVDVTIEGVGNQRVWF